jgi:hypothetical protein
MHDKSSLKAKIAQYINYLPIQSIYSIAISALTQYSTISSNDNQNSPQFSNLKKDNRQKF